MKPPIERTRAGYLLAILNHVAEHAGEEMGRIGSTELRKMIGGAERAMVAHAVEHNLRGQKIENYAEAYNQRIIGVNRADFYTAVLDVMRGSPDHLNLILDTAPQYAGRWSEALMAERRRVLFALQSTGAEIAWRSVTRRSEAEANLRRYAAGSRADQQSVSWGRYFAWDPETGTVAPSKFAGVFGMTFERYQDPVLTAQSAFHGGATQMALRGLSLAINSECALEALRRHARELGKNLPADPEVFEIGRIPNHYALLGKRSIYDTLAASRVLAEDVWAMPAGDVEPGDKLVFWQTKDSEGNRGIVAFGEVTASAAELEAPDASMDFWGEGHEIPRFARRISYRYLPAPGGPLWLGGAHDGLLSSLTVAKAQGNKLYHVSSDQWAALCAAVREDAQVTGPAPYTLDDALQELFLEREKAEQILASLRRKKNIILEGPPGVGKSFMARRLAYVLAGAKDPSRVEMVQFHQSYAYEDFIQGFRPNESGTFERRDGVFFAFSRRAAEDPTGRPYVFVIDEINRGNLSKIFGELMLLVEPDKRGPDFSMPLTYSRGPEDRFYVPENLYIIGMMNTADRSLAMVDYALRRRFVFHAIHPEFRSPRFSAHLEAHGVSPELRHRLVQRLTALNDRISDDRKHLGPGFAIGHSFFCPTGPGVYDDAWYADIIHTEVAPLLDEYWFDDVETASGHAQALLRP